MDEYGTEKNFGRESQGSNYYGESSYRRDSIGRRVMDSFKRDPNVNMTPKGTLGADGKVFDVESAAQNTATSPLSRRLKGRHLQMIAIGGSIGTNFSIHVSTLPSNSCSRYRSIRRLGSSARQRRPCKSRDSLLSCRHHDVLYRPRPRRNGRSLSCRRFILCLLDPFS